jgi:hypothetical protein
MLSKFFPERSVHRGKFIFEWCLADSVMQRVSEDVGNHCQQMMQSVYFLPEEKFLTKPSTSMILAVEVT